MEIWIIKFIAVSVATLVGHPILSWLTDSLRELRCEELKGRKKVKCLKKGRAGKRIGMFLGFFERAITVLIWFWGHYEFIGFWFAGKVIGDWKRRNTDEEGAFSSYLLATGLSISIAVIVALGAEYIIENCLARQF